MKIIKSVDFTEVLEIFDREHSQSPTHFWARKLLKHANTFYLGKWNLVQLSSREIKNRITLMNHQHGDMELIPREGSTVVGAADKLLQTHKEYAERNKECFTRIQQLKKASFSPVFLASQSPKGYKILGHEEVSPPEDNFFHLDGLHRMIAWYLEGRLKPHHYFFSKKLTAYVAGDIK